MRIIAAIILIVLQFTSKSQSAKNFNCINQNLDKYDVQIHEITIDGVSSEKNHKIEKRYNSFKPCRVMTYSTSYFTKRNELILQDTIIFYATGERWSNQPNLQNELKIKYSNKDESTRIMLETFNVNSSKPLDWKSQVTEGVIENKELVWMHPFRFHHYQFTEIAPFPRISLPPAIGNKWKTSIFCVKGWGDWNGSETRTKGEIIGNDDLTLGIGTLSNC